MDRTTKGRSIEVFPIWGEIDPPEGVEVRKGKRFDRELVVVYNAKNDKHVAVQASSFSLSKLKRLYKVVGVEVRETSATDSL